MKQLGESTLKKNLIILDTNIIVRFLIGDDEKNYQKSLSIFSDIEAERIHAILLESVFAEIVFVLEKVYRIERDIIADHLLKILKLRGIRLAKKEIFTKALEIYQIQKIDIVDCILCSHNLLTHIDILSFDRDIEKTIRFMVRESKSFPKQG